jgi:hypothetical protein
LAQAVGFYEQGLQGIAFQGLEGWIESFDMTNLQDPTGLFGLGYKFLRLIRIGGHRFFNKQMAPLLHSLFSYMKVVLSWDDDRYSLDMLQEGSKGGIGLAAADRGHFLATGGVYIKDSDELEFRQAGGQPGMNGPKMADSNDAEGD